MNSNSLLTFSLKRHCQISSKSVNIQSNGQTLVSGDQITFFLSLSLSFPVGGAGHRPNPFHVAPEASRVGSEGVSWPGVPPGVIVGRTLEHQMLDRLVGAVTVQADGRVSAPDTVKVSRHQWGMTSAYLCHRHALVPVPIPLPTLVTVLSACKNSMDPQSELACIVMCYVHCSVHEENYCLLVLVAKLP